MAKFKLLTDLQDSYNELVYKVSWPSKKDLANSTVIVMVASILMAIVIWAIDVVFDTVSNDFLTCRRTQLLPEIAGERLTEKGNYLILFSTTKTLVTDFVYNG